MDPVWTMGAMAVSVTAIFAISPWGRPGLLFDAVRSVARQEAEPEVASDAGGAGMRIGVAAVAVGDHPILLTRTSASCPGRRGPPPATGTTPIKASIA